VSNPDPGERPGDVVERLRAEVAALRRSRRRLVEAADEQRRGIERALHDGVQQDLVALAVDLRRVTGLLDTDPATARALLGEMAGNVGRAMDETMALAERVSPPMLELGGLASAVRAAADRAGVAVRVELPAGARYPAEVAAAIYWATVQALASASPGSEASVTVLDGEGVVTFDVEIVGEVRGDQLEGPRDRIEAFDGGLSVDETSRDGVARLHGWLPLSR